MGEIDGGGGEGGAPGGDGEGEFDDCGEPFGAAKRRTGAEGGGICGAAGDKNQGRRGQRDLDRVSGRIADRRAAGDGSDDSRILGGVLVIGGRGFAGERRSVPGDPSGAGGEPGRALADEHAVWEARFLLRRVGGGQGEPGRAEVGADLRAGDGVSANSARGAGGRARDDGRAMVPAGVSVRVHGDGERGVRPGRGGPGDPVGYQAAEDS